MGGYNYAGFVAGKADCTIYGAAKSDKEEQDKWELVYAEPQNREIAISDEETKTVSVDETTCLWEIITEGNKGKYPNGIWFAGTKYTLVRQQDLDVEGQNVTVYFCSRPGGGCCIACSGQSVVVAFSDKKRGRMAEIPRKRSSTWSAICFLRSDLKRRAASF